MNARQIIVEDDQQKAASPLCDADLVYRVQAGDTGAFDLIDDQYRAILVRFLRRFCYGQEAAEELAQRTLIRAYEMIDQLKSGERLVGWLHRIAFRIAASERRRRPSVSLDTAIHEKAVSMPDLLVEEEERRNIWDVARKELTNEEFQILSLRYAEDLSLQQIAEIVKKKEGTVRVVLHRARKKLLPVFDRG